MESKDNGDAVEGSEVEVEIKPQNFPEDVEYNGSESDTEEKQLDPFKVVKKSILKRKKRAARIRNALCKKTNILKIKLWQNLLPTFPHKRPTPTPSPPPAEQSRSPSPSPPPSLAHRFSPDITQYRRKPLLLAPKQRLGSSNKSSSSSSSSESESENEVNKVKKHQGNGDSMSLKSRASSDDSGDQSGDTDGSLLFCDKGDPIVKLDATFVKDFLQSGKPIRAAALAALEAVHGKKISETEALHRLRKAYIAKPTLPKGRGRRSIIKRAAKPLRSVRLDNWCSIINSVTYRNSYFQVGDIVFVIGENRQIYFLQIRTLMMDRREYEVYASMMWLTPKPEFEGPRFPFHPGNYNLRRDIPPSVEMLDNVTHVLHCPLDYFEGHPSYWQPLPGTVYQRLGEPLVKWIKLEEKKIEIQKEAKKDDDKESSATPDDQDNIDIAQIDTEELADMIPELEKMETVSSPEPTPNEYQNGPCSSPPQIVNDFQDTVDTPCVEVEIETT